MEKKQNSTYEIEREYTEKMAKVCGSKATSVYNSLCASNKTDVTLIALENGMTRDEVFIGLRKLEDYNIVRIGIFLTNKHDWITEF